MRALKRSLAIAVMMALLAFPFFVYFNAQALVDWWQLRGYIPPPAVSDLADKDTMTAYARHVFYVNRPNIESDVSAFRNNCNESEKTIVLGCYHPSQNGIFLYNVTDSRLAGEQEVTAAHEMLHAAYDRLSHNDKDNINAQLQDFYDHGLHDQRIIETINSYRQSEPKDLVNEMHSVFGTEVASLPSALESYYSRYFSDRHQIAALAASYESEFTNREDQIKADDTRLSQIKNQIDSQEQSLDAQLTQINNDRARLDSLRASGRIAEFNASVGSFDVEVSAYNNGVDELRGNIRIYNQLVSSRNEIASELASLSKSIDTRAVPQTTQ